MKRVALICCAVGLVVLAGCGGSGLAPGGDGYAALSEATETVTLGVAADDGLVPRWMDVRDVPYTSDCGGSPFETSYDYEDAVVTASFESPTDQLRITLAGVALKPNFAYQVKLEGLPDVDSEGNSTLGQLGRRWKGLGYLIFGYFVTDENGDINTCASSQWWPDSTIPVDSSYHVLWRTDQRAPRGNDGPVIDDRVWETCFGYSRAQGELVDTGDTRHVYGEWERRRPTPGELVLPDHTYTCLLRLTEEAFHMKDASGALVYGWKTVLDAEITFTIGSGGEPPPPETGGIQGTVYGPNGRRVAGATVTATNNGVSKQTTSAKNGRYKLTDLPAGIYTVTGSKDGVGSVTVFDVQVFAGGTTRQDLHLKQQ